MSRNNNPAAAPRVPRLAGEAAPLDDEESHGAPHAGVAPLVTVRRPGRAPASSRTRSSAACCRIRRCSRRRPRSSASSTRAASPTAHAPSTTAASSTCSTTTRARRSSTREHHDAAAREVAARRGAARRAPLRARLLRVRPDREVEVGRFRCLNLDARAEVLASGPRLRQRLVAQRALPRPRGRARRDPFPARETPSTRASARRTG